MNFRLLMCIAMGVFVTYVGVVMLVAQFRAKPYTPRPKPNFSAHSTVYVDPQTGEKTVVREITVSTKFASARITPPPGQPQLETAKTPAEPTAPVLGSSVAPLR